MKTLTKIAIGFALTGTLAAPGILKPAHAGWLDDVKKHAKDSAQNKSKQKATDKVDKTIDEVLEGENQEQGNNYDETAEYEETDQAAANADQPAADNTDTGYVVTDSRGNEVYFPLGELSFADRVVEYKPTKVPDYAKDPNDALGPPNYTSGDDNYVSLGNNGSLTLQFTDNYLVDIEGPDLWIFEIGPQVEPTNVAISKDGVNWIHVGKVEGGTSGIDIGPKVQPGDRFSYVKLMDANARKSNDGADIDAVGAIGSIIRDDYSPEVDSEIPAPSTASDYKLEISLSSGITHKIPMDKIQTIKTVPKKDQRDCFNLQVDMKDGTSITLDLSKVERMTPVFE